jgi:hypothetical protein
MTAEAVVAALEGKGWDKCRVEPLGVMGNNRVLRAEIRGRKYLVKEYFQDADDPRDRFGAERAFYSFLWEAGTRSIPEPIAWYPGDRFALLEFVSGQKPVAATEKLVRNAIEFFIEINSHRELPGARLLPSASEACFSIADHLASVSRRVDRLAQNGFGTKLHEAAVQFVRERLRPAWVHLRDEIERQSAGNDTLLAPSARCISPSDFGFHNAIVANDGRLRFFDFEYAGWDDPAKTICDFFCQPAVPVSLHWMATFVDAISGNVGGPELGARASLLLPVYQTKWCCIMLNDFLPVGNRRRTFSNPNADDQIRHKRQLDKAIAFHEAVFR